MELADDFRIRAQRCLALAGAAPTLEAQTHWLGMAQLWLNLAQYAEEQDQHPVRKAPPRWPPARAEHIPLSPAGSHAKKAPAQGRG